MTSDPLSALLAEIRSCRVCEPQLPLGARPVLQAHRASRVLVVGQAPGRRAHATSLPFDDPSGDRLRGWLGVDRAAFYDPHRFALVPMGFCYPGTARGGDAPPRPECAPLWRPRLLPMLSNVRLTLLLGRHAIAWHLGERGRLTDVVRRWREFGDVVPAPHPSPRNTRWFARNPWFDEELVPQLRERVRRCG